MHPVYSFYSNVPGGKKAVHPKNFTIISMESQPEVISTAAQGVPLYIMAEIPPLTFPAINKTGKVCLWYWNYVQYVNCGGWSHRLSVFQM